MNNNSFQARLKLKKQAQEKPLPPHIQQAIDMANEQIKLHQEQIENLNMLIARLKMDSDKYWKGAKKKNEC